MVRRVNLLYSVWNRFKSKGGKVVVVKEKLRTLRDVMELPIVRVEFCGTLQAPFLLLPSHKIGSSPLSSSSKGKGL